MTRLERKVGDLEKRLKAVESRTNWAVQPFIQPWPGNRPAIQTPRGLFQPALPNSRVPEIWGQGEVNGWPYYVVPVADGHGLPNPGGHSKP